MLELLQGEPVVIDLKAVPVLAANTASLAELPDAGLDLRTHLAAIERALIEQALERTQGTVAHAARLLNLRRTTLVERLRKLGILGGPGATEV